MNICSAWLRAVSAAAIFVFVSATPDAAFPQSGKRQALTEEYFKGNGFKIGRAIWPIYALGLDNGKDDIAAGLQPILRNDGIRQNQNIIAVQITFAIFDECGDTPDSEASLKAADLKAKFALNRTCGVEDLFCSKGPRADIYNDTISFIRKQPNKCDDVQVNVVRRGLSLFLPHTYF